MKENNNPVMKVMYYLLLACMFIGAFALTGCTVNVNINNPDTVKDEADEAEVTQEDIEEVILGSWIVADRNGQPALTNEKGVFTFVSPTEAYISASFSARPELGTPWMSMLKAEAEIDGNRVIITRKGDDEAAMVNEMIISDINDAETQGSLVVKSVNDGEETVITEESIRFVKVNDDYSEDIIGTWEGCCTSDGSVFDDGQEHRWEYKADGTYIYYIKDGDEWIPSDNTLNEYFVDGNLLCTRWVEGDEENREWWEVSIDGDKMNWTALREDEDGNTFTSTFEMTKVEE